MCSNILPFVGCFLADRNVICLKNLYLRYRSVGILIDSSETSQPYIALKTPTSGATQVHKPCRSEPPAYPGSPCLGAKGGAKTDGFYASKS